MTRLDRSGVGVFTLVVGLALTVACGSKDTVAPPALPPDAVTLSAGGSAPVVNGQQVEVVGGATGSEYLLVVTDTATGATGTSAFQLAASAIGAAGSVSGPATARAPGDAATLDRARAPLAPLPTPTLDIGYGTRLNERVRRRLVAAFPAARQAARRGPAGLAPSLVRSPGQPAAALAVGDLLTYNVSARACDSIVTHPARVVAIGTTALIVADTLNPPGGFTPADYQRFAATFDTLVYPLDVAHFGAPTDIDANGRVVLFFTRAVNALTPKNAQSYVGGFFFARDLFPTTSTPALSACAGSNVAEMFYLLVPDPTGVVNGNVRTAGFVDSLTIGVVAHEFQHLINAGRRLYLTNASEFEVVWLNEGLSHIAEELLFYRQGGVQPRQNLDVAAIRARPATRTAFNLVQGANAARYREYLKAPATSSPLRNDDSLSTRGATWSFLRYAADRKLRAGGQDSDVWQALVSVDTGVANLRRVFGADLGGQLRDWAVSHYTDDVVPGVTADYLQPSWDWHAIYPALGGGGGSYPLAVTSLPATGTAGTVIPGGAAYYRFAVPPNALASLVLTGGTAKTGLPHGTIVRLR